MTRLVTIVALASIIHQIYGYVHQAIAFSITCQVGDSIEWPDNDVCLDRGQEKCDYPVVSEVYYACYELPLFLIPMPYDIPAANTYSNKL